MKHISMRTLALSCASALLFSTTSYATGYDGKGGVDDGSPIVQTELSMKGYQFPNDLVSGADDTELAYHAWRLFIAANQPTTATLKSGSGRAEPDSTRSFNDTDGSASQSNPTVWESFYHRAEAFPYYKATGSQPASPKDNVPTYYYYLGETSSSRTADQNKITGGQYVNLDENNQVGQNLLYYKNSKAPDFPVLFMAKVNEIELDYVYPITAGQFAPNSLEFPNPEVTSTTKKSTIEVKSAWRRVSDMKNVDASKFHQASASYYVGDSSESYTMETDTFALIALHIIQKTHNYPTFIFTTFEHVDAVVTNSDKEIIDPHIKLSYKTLAYGENSNSQTNTYGAYSVNGPGQSGESNVRTDYTLTAAFTGSDIPAEFPVTRLKTITSEVNDVNNAVVGLMPSDSVWKNYRLKGVQAVPSSYSSTNKTVPANYYLANIVVESSQPGLQLFAGTVSNPNDTNELTFTNCRALPIDSDKIPTSAKDTGDVYNGCASGTKNANPPYPSGPNVAEAPSDGKIGIAKWTMGGCMGCHGNAQTAGQDMSFLGFGIAGAGFFADPVAADDLTDAEKEAFYQSSMESKSKNLQDSLQ